MSFLPLRVTDLRPRRARLDGDLCGRRLHADGERHDLFLLRRRPAAHGARLRSPLSSAPYNRSGDRVLNGRACYATAYATPRIHPHSQFELSTNVIS